MTIIREKDKPKPKQIRHKVVPEVLIYEKMADGTPIYYQGYEQYLKGTKTAEALMGSSYLQGHIISVLFEYLLDVLPKTYRVMTNELGLQYSKKGWRASDIVVYEKEKLKAIPLNNKYMPIPPKIVIEVDTKAAFDNFTTPMDYFTQKTDDLLNFGVEKVIWIFSATHKIMLAEKGKNWTISDWNQDIQLTSEINLNLETLLKENEL